MRTRKRKAVVAALAVIAVMLIASQAAHLQTQLTLTRCPIQATPQGVVIGEAASGLMKTASVLVTNVSRGEVPVTVYWQKPWLRVSPTQFSLGPGQSAKLSLIGTFDSLQKRFEVADPPVSLPVKPPKPVMDAEVVWICGGQVCTPVAVFAVKMTPQQ